jgi:hypothetical protein
MRHRYLEILSTPSVRAARARYGSAAQYEALMARSEPAERPRLGPDETEFIAARDGFYIASVSEGGWPYLQFRGGPPGFLSVLDDSTLGYADFRGNRQYITVGNAASDDRVALFLMDYANRRRLKILAHLRFVDGPEAPALAERLAVTGYRGRVERAALIRVAAFDWNCPQHITPRFSLAELDPLVANAAVEG